MLWCVIVFSTCDYFQIPVVCLFITQFYLKKLKWINYHLSESFLKKKRISSVQNYIYRMSYRTQFPFSYKAIKFILVNSGTWCLLKQMITEIYQFKFGNSFMLGFINSHHSFHISIFYKLMILTSEVKVSNRHNSFKLDKTHFKRLLLLYLSST